MKEQLEKWLNEAIRKLKDKYFSSGLKASGKWEKELTGTIDEKEGGFLITIEGTNYTWHLVHGRKPTAPNKRGKLYGIILKWVQDKGINVDNPKRFAYLVARKIDEQGIKVPNQYNDGRLLDSLTGDVEDLKKVVQDYYSISIKSDVIKEFKNGNWN